MALDPIHGGDVAQRQRFFNALRQRHLEFYRDAFAATGCAPRRDQPGISASGLADRAASACEPRATGPPRQRGLGSGSPL